MTEFQSRRELREAERQGLVVKPEQVFDLPTGQISLPENSPIENSSLDNSQSTHVSNLDLPAASEMLTRKRIREMERQGLLDPLTGAVPVSVEATATPVVEPRAYDEVLAETEEPITSSINTVRPSLPQVAEPVAATDIFHSMAVDVTARRPRLGLIIGAILVVLAGAGTAAYMLGIFK